MEIPYFSKDKEIIDLYHKKWRGDASKEDRHELDCLLSERKMTLDEEFEWTEENIQKFKTISKKVDECLKHFVMINRHLPGLLLKRCSNDPSNFLNDFEMGYQMTPIVRWIDENGEECEDEGIYEVLQAEIMEGRDLYSDYEFFEASMYFYKRDEDGSRTGTLAFDVDCLKGVYVNYVFHELSSHLSWSLKDILNITEFWGEVVLRAQHFAK